MSKHDDSFYLGHIPEAITKVYWSRIIVGGDETTIVRRLYWILPLAVLVILLGALGFRLAQHQATALHLAESYAVPHPIPTLQPRHMTPLLQKEVTLLSYCPANQQLAWVTIGRPPIYYAPQSHVYYFGQRYQAAVVLTPDDSEAHPFSPSIASWYGQPIKP